MHNLRVVSIWFFVFSALAICAVTAKAAQRNDPYVLAVIPAAPPSIIYALWTPVIKELSRETGLDFELKVYDRMLNFEQDISKGTPDFIFTNPVQAVVAHDEQGYIPLVRDSNLVSVELFVRKNSSIKTIDDLSGKKIALVGNKNL